MSAITTHVLDVARGRPAASVAVVLDFRAEGGQWHTLGRANTDADGRARNLLPVNHTLAAGVYRLSFDVGSYFRTLGVECFYPSIPIVFEIRAPSENYHLPLLLSPFGYSTYRGS
jgi:5-hydroxyisourate hydrolase